MLLGYHPFYNPAGSAYTYRNILHKSVSLPPQITARVRNLLEGLLQKDAMQRLGSIDAKDQVICSLISALHRIKAYLRSSMTQQMLNNLMLIHVHKEHTD